LAVTKILQTSADINTIFLQAKSNKALAITIV